MAGSIWVANTTAETLLASSSQKCLIRLIAPSSFQVKLKEWGVYFDGVASTAPPVVVQLCLTDTSFGVYTAHTPFKRTGRPTACQSVAQTMNTSSDPTIFSVLATREVHPQCGYQEKFAYGDEPTICGVTTAAGSVAALIVNSPTSIYAVGEIVFEE